MCGLMLENWKQSCATQKALTEFPDDLKGKINKAGTANTDSSELDQAGSDAVSVLDDFASRLNIPNSACPGDYTFSVMGAPITVQLSQACDIFRIIRLFMWIAVYFLCARMILSAI